MTLHKIKMAAVLDALERHKGDRTRVAKELDVSIRSLRNWIRLDEALKSFRTNRTGKKQ